MPRPALSSAEAAVAAPQALALCDALQRCGDDWEGEVDDVMDKFQISAGRRPLYHVCFY